MTKAGTLTKAVRAERIDSTGRRTTRSYGQGRVCQTEGCGTVLSRYNNGRTCSACTLPKLPERREELRLERSAHRRHSVPDDLAEVVRALKRRRGLVTTEEVAASTGRSQRETLRCLEEARRSGLVLRSSTSSGKPLWSYA